MSRRRVITWAFGAALVVLLVVFPLFTSSFFTSTVGIRALWLGMGAVSLTFLAGYGGMVSLGQTALYGIGGFTMANPVAADGGAQHGGFFASQPGADWTPFWTPA